MRGAAHGRDHALTTRASGSIAEAAEKIETLMALEEMQRQRTHLPTQPHRTERLTGRPHGQRLNLVAPFASPARGSELRTEARALDHAPVLQPVAFAARRPPAPDRNPAIRPAFAPAIPAIVTIPEWLPPVLAILGLGGLLTSDTIQEDEETKRCKEVKDKCIEKCSDTLPTPRWDQGMPFHRCVNRCLRDNRCPGPLGAEGKYEDE